MESERILHSSLMQRLQTVRDYRGGRKPQYPLWLMLLLALLGVMSGCYGYKALEYVLLGGAMPSVESEFSLALC